MSGKPFVELFGGIEHESLTLGSFLALGHQRRVLVAFEQTGHFAVGQQSVHPLQESRFHDVGFVQHEADLLVLAAGPAQQLTQIFVKVGSRVLVVHFNLSFIHYYSLGFIQY